MIGNYCRSRAASFASYVVAFFNTIAVLSGYLSFVLCDFLRVKPGIPDPELYEDDISLGIFCTADDEDVASEVNQSDTLWQVAKIFGVTSLILGLLGTIMCYVVMIMPRILLRTTKTAELVWHCLSAFCCLAALLEVWVLLPYASEVCSTDGNQCRPGNGTFLLALSFVLYFLSALIVEMWIAPTSLNEKHNGAEIRRNGNDNAASPPQQPIPYGVDTYDVFSPTVISNVSSITGASAFLQMEVDSVGRALEQQEKSESEKSWTGFPMNQDPNSIWQKNIEPEKIPSHASTADSTPLPSPENNQKPPQPPRSSPTQITFAPIIAGNVKDSSNEKNKITSRNSSNQTAYVETDKINEVVHEVNGSIPLSTIIKQKTPRSSPVTTTSASGILRKSRFDRVYSPESKGRVASPSPISLRIRDSPDIREQAKDAVNDPDWPESLHLVSGVNKQNQQNIIASPAAIRQQRETVSPRSSVKSVRMKYTGKSLVDSSEDESILYK